MKSCIIKVFTTLSLFFYVHHSKKSTMYYLLIPIWRRWSQWLQRVSCKSISVSKTTRSDRRDFRIYRMTCSSDAFWSRTTRTQKSRRYHCSSRSMNTGCKRSKNIRISEASSWTYVGRSSK